MSIQREHVSSCHTFALFLFYSHVYIDFYVIYDILDLEIDINNYRFHIDIQKGDLTRAIPLLFTATDS